MKKVLISIICSLILFTGCSNTKKDSSQIKIVKYENDKVSLDYTIVDEKNIIIEAINNGESFDYATINLAVYDKNNKLIDVEKQYLHKLNSKQKNVIKVVLNDLEDKKASKIEMSVKTGKYENSIEESYIEKVEGKIEKTETDGELKIDILNNSGKTLDSLSATVVFSKKGKIIDIYSLTAQNIEASYTENVYIPLVTKNDGSMSYIDYDDAKVIINYAIAYTEVK